MDKNPNETTETDFNSTLIDDETLFSSHTKSTLSLIDLEIKNSNNNNNSVESITRESILNNIESITRASEEEFKTLALRNEQTARKAYVNNAPEMQNAKMNDALVKALDL